MSKGFYKQPMKIDILAQNFPRTQSGPHTAVPGTRELAERRRGRMYGGQCRSPALPNS